MAEVGGRTAEAAEARLCFFDFFAAEAEIVPGTHTDSAVRAVGAVVDAAGGAFPGTAAGRFLRVFPKVIHVPEQAEPSRQPSIPYTKEERRSRTSAFRSGSRSGLPADSRGTRRRRRRRRSG